MKSTDLDYKYERALGFLDSNKCYGALPLLEEVVSLTRGTERSVDAQYNFAQAHRCVGDYYLARYYFKLFAKTFPNDPRAEKAQFESAICSYILSPKPSLDQLDTEQEWRESDFWFFIPPDSIPRVRRPKGPNEKSSNTWSSPT